MKDPEALLELFDLEPQLSTWTRVLQVQSPGSSSQSTIAKDVESVIYRLPNLLPDKLTRIHTIRFLHIPRIDWDPDQLVPFIHSLSALISVKTLVFYSCLFQLGIIKTVTSALPNLQSMEILNRCEFDRYWTQTRPNPLPDHEPALTSLRICQLRDSFFPPDALEKLLQWMGTTKTVESLRELEIDIYFTRQLGDVQNFIQKLGVTLRTFRLSISSHSPTELFHECFAVKHLINLSRCGGLRELELRGLNQDANLYILSKVPASQLEKITFSTSFPWVDTGQTDLDHMKRSDFQRWFEFFSLEEFVEWDEFLARPRFNSVQEVCFLYTGNRPYADVEILNDAFPGLAARGILRLVKVSD